MTGKQEQKYIFTPEMAEISGMGGPYEECCRSMLKAGLEWLDEHPDADPKYTGYKGIYGIIDEDNLDAENMSRAVVDGAGGDCTGAMHQAVISSIMWIRRRSWAEYVAEMARKR